MPDQDHPPTGAPPEPSSAEVALTEEQRKRAAEQDERDELFTLLRGLRRGQFSVDLARALREVTKAVHDTGAKGTVTLKFTVGTVKNAMPGSVSVDDAIVAKPPVLNKRSTIMFATPAGALTYDHPDQFAAFHLERDSSPRSGA